MCECEHVWIHTGGRVVSPAVIWPRALAQTSCTSLLNTHFYSISFVCMRKGVGVCYLCVVV